MNPTPETPKIKVAHLINGLGVGGAETMLVKLLARIDRNCFDSVVITLTDGGALRDALADIGVEVHSLGMRRGLPTPAGFLRLIRILRKESPRILQTWLYHADLLGLICARLTGVPICAWNIRVSNVEMLRYPRMSRWVLRASAMLSGWPDLVLVNSVMGRRSHSALKYHPRKWQVIPNGFDLEKFRPDNKIRLEFRKAWTLADSFLVGLVARYDPMKDHKTFLKAAQSFHRIRPDAHFLLAGTGVDEDNRTLTGLVEELGIRDAVTLLGERRDMKSVLPALDVLTLSSAFGEGFSNAIGEGMACEVPCVVTDVGDMAEIVGKTGRVVPPKDPAALASAWNDLYEIGPGARRALGAAARIRIDRSFSLAKIVCRYEQTYRELAEKEPARARVSALS